MIKDGPLLFRPELIEEESILNYIYRLTMANKYPSMTYISELLNINLSSINGNSLSEDALNELSKLTLHLKELLFERTAQYFESYFEENAFQLIHKGKVKYCPFCLNKDLKHKKVWNLNFVNICPTHNVLLIDKCDNCNNRLSFSSLIYTHCIECGYELRKSTIKLLDSGSGIFLSQHFILELLEGKNVKFLWDINLKQYMELSLRSLILLDGLPSFIDFDSEKPIINSLFSTKGGTQSNLQFAQAFANVYWMYQDFPRNFFIVLDEFYQKHYLKRKYPKKRFEELFNNGEFTLIQKSYEDFWKMKVKEGNVHQNFLLRQEKFQDIEIDNLTKYAAMQRFGFSKEEVREIWKSDDLLVELKRSGKKQLLLAHESIDKLQNELNTWAFMITKKEAIDILGIAVKMFNSLIKAGYIQIKNVPWHKNEFIDRRQLNDFINKYVGNSLMLESGIGLHDAIRKYEKRGLNIEAVLKLIDINKLTPFLDKYNGSFGDLKFDNEELSDCLEYAFIDGQIMYTLTNLEKKFKMEKLTLHKMIQKGILIPGKTTMTSGGKKRYYFLISEIDEFLQKHITVPNAAVEYNVSRDILYRLLRKGKIKNVLEGISKMHLLKRDELINILLQKRMLKIKL